MFVITYTTSQNISSLKEEFNAVFPFLKLELEDLSKIQKKDTLEPIFNKRISNINFTTKKFKRGYIHVTEEMSVTLLEKQFEDQFGIAMRVFRKSGNSWIGTNLTNDWSLKRQNDEGNALKLFVKEKIKIKRNLL